MDDVRMMKSEEERTALNFKAFQSIGKALEPLDEENRMRVLISIEIMHGVESKMRHVRDVLAVTADSLMGPKVGD